MDIYTCTYILTNIHFFMMYVHEYWYMCIHMEVFDVCVCVCVLCVCYS